MFVLLIHSCSSDESNTPIDPNIENNRPLGTAAEDILGPSEFSSLTIELVYTNSFRPEPSSILGFKNFVLRNTMAKMVTTKGMKCFIPLP